MSDHRIGRNSRFAHRALGLLLSGSLLLGGLFLPGSTSAAQLLRDINTQIVERSSNPRQFTTMGSVTFFIAEDDEHGAELWRTDGTAAGTFLLSDIRPGPDTSYATDFVVANGLLFFSADDGVNGREVWRSDGTVGGTYMLSDIAPGAASGFVGTTVQISNNGVISTITVQSRYPMVASGPYVYFIASDGPSGAELWRSDGTASGTVCLTDLAPANTTTTTIGHLTAFGSRLAFTASDSAYGEELWLTDGSIAGTVRVADVNSGAASASPDQLTAAGSQLFFVANDGQHGRELWRTDGTTAGTYFVRDIFTGTGDSQINSLTAVGDEVRFVATADRVANGVHSNDIELWHSDGTAAGTAAVTNLFAFNNPGPRFVTKFGNRIVYRVGDLGFAAQPAEVWITDGTPAGTTRLFQSTSIDVSGRRSSTPVVAGNKLFFMDQTAADGAGIWVSDGTNAGTTVIASTLATPTADTLKLVGSTTGLAFFFDANAQFIDVLWRTDGTVTGTFPLGSVQAVGSLSYFSGVATAGALAYFTPHDPVIGTELDVTDGTVSGTRLVKNIAVSAENDGSAPFGFTGVGGKVLFSAFPGGTNSRQLWTTDGTNAGTQLLVDIAPNEPVHGITQLIGVGGHTLMSAGTAAGGTELWTTDGTAAGTTLLKDLIPGPEGSNPDLSSGVLLNSALIFPTSGDSGTHAIWRSDGTAAGTIALYSTTAPPNTYSLSDLYAAGSYVYFTSTDSGAKILWRTDGTVAGTQPALVPAMTVTKVLGAAGGFVYFLGSDGANPLQVWRTDGTPAGTLALTNLQGQTDAGAGHALGQRFLFGVCPWGAACGLYSSDGSVTGTTRLLDLDLNLYIPGNGVTIGNHWFFSASSARSNDPEPWVSDGTSAGTHQIAKLNTGAGAYPSSFVAFGGVALFAADSSAFGPSIWRTDGTAGGTALVADPAVRTPFNFVGNLTPIGDRLYFAASNGHTGVEPFVITATAPVAGDDEYIVAPPSITKLAVLRNDGIVNGSIDHASVAIVTPPTLGTAAVDAGTGEIVYTPNVSIGRDFLTYTVKSAVGTLSNIGRVDLIVGGAPAPGPGGPPSIALSATPTSFQSPPAQQVNLTWSATNNTSSCTASGDWSGTKATAGSESVGPISKTSTFTLSCTGLGGSSSQSVKVTVSTAQLQAGHSGGGGFGDWEVVCLGLLTLLSRLRRYNHSKSSRTSPT
jgi:ELWxxDGT repeat protein